jgi:hypothetical protein
MKMLKLLLFGFLFSLAQVSLAEDYVDLLNLSKYKEGDAIPALGENLAVGLVEKTGEKYVTVLKDSDGKLTVPANLSGEFEILMKMKPEGRMEIFVVPSDNESLSKVRLTTDCCSGQLRLEGYAEVQDVAWNNSNINDYRLLISGSMIKLYVNGLYREKAKLANPASTVYSSLLMNHTGSNFQLYELKVRNLSGTSPISSDNNYETGKQAGIQQCVTNPSSCGINVGSNSTNSCIANYATNGELHIPCVNVPGAFGKIETYDVWMQQQAGAFVFDLDLNRVQLR